MRRSQDDRQTGGFFDGIQTGRVMNPAPFLICCSGREFKPLLSLSPSEYKINNQNKHNNSNNRGSKYFHIGGDKHHPGNESLMFGVGLRNQAKVVSYPRDHTVDKSARRDLIVAG